MSGLSIVVFVTTVGVYLVGVVMGWWARGRAEKNMRQSKPESGDG